MQAEKKNGFLFFSHQYNNLCIVQVVKSSWLPVKITTYLVSISRLLCLVQISSWMAFLNKISLDWKVTLTTQSCTSKLSNDPDCHAITVLRSPSTEILEIYFCS